MNSFGPVISDVQNYGDRMIIDNDVRDGDGGVSSSWIAFGDIDHCRDIRV